MKMGSQFLNLQFVKRKQGIESIDFLLFVVTLKMRRVKVMFFTVFLLTQTSLHHFQTPFLLLLWPAFARRCMLTQHPLVVTCKLKVLHAILLFLWLLLLLLLLFILQCHLLTQTAQSMLVQREIASTLKQLNRVARVDRRYKCIGAGCIVRNVQCIAHLMPRAINRVVIVATTHHERIVATDHGQDLHPKQTEVHPWPTILDRLRETNHESHPLDAVVDTRLVIHQIGLCLNIVGSRRRVGCCIRIIALIGDILRIANGRIIKRSRAAIGIGIGIGRSGNLRCSSRSGRHMSMARVNAQLVEEERQLLQLLQVVVLVVRRHHTVQFQLMQIGQVADGAINGFRRQAVAIGDIQDAQVRTGLRDERERFIRERMAILQVDLEHVVEALLCVVQQDVLQQVVVRTLTVLAEIESAPEHWLICAHLPCATHLRNLTQIAVVEERETVQE
mmetsp:Transcript_39178/g.64081  ORF Transcript_39178/g.64081 Transcript_39178/m.64081 type:complete len:446 (+) Transcript_39178:246-1583(+)